MPDVPNIDIRPDHWKIVRDTLRKHVPQYEVWAFGSRAKWTAKQYSDLDLAIITDKPLSLKVGASLADDFSESDLPWKVDIVDWATTSESFRKIIERDKVVVQGSERVEGWHETTLGDFVRLQRGHDLTAEERESGEYPVMGSAGKNGTHSKFIATGPGVVIGRSGASMGRVHFTPHDYWPHNTCLYVTDFLGNDPRFAFYLLGSLDLASYNSGSAQPSLNRNYIYGKPILIPSPQEQSKIAETLGALDDRMENLRQTNDTLEAIAAALFKSWFVDFDGVPSGNMQESELGLIPKAWRVGTLADLCELKYGKALKSSERQEGEVPVYGSGGITGFHDEALVTKPTIIVGRKGTVGALYWQTGPCFPIDTVFYAEPRVSLHFCYQAMMRMGLQNLNTDAAVPGLNRDNAYRQRVVIPSADALSKWDDFASKIRTRMDASELQAATLATVRDTLLPRLVSGRLRIKTAA